MRGKRDQHLLGPKFGGITPAGAGKTLLIMSSVSLIEDHPRRCGENLCISLQIPTVAGSPPQVRGKLYGDMSGLACIRITPAGAGKTDRRNVRYSDKKDHPRRCGENRIAAARPLCSRGSPPQVRGKHDGLLKDDAVIGITPAGAGKTNHD